MSRVPKVLLVDDDEANLFTLEALLEEADLDITIADSYEAAEARLKKDSPYDLVILDRGLGGRDGAELAPLCRSRAASTRVALLSGQDTHDLKLPDIDAYFTKGGNVDTLIESLKSLVEEV